MLPATDRPPATRRPRPSRRPPRPRRRCGARPARRPRERHRATPCRSGSRTGSSELPSLSHVAPSSSARPSSASPDSFRSIRPRPRHSPATPTAATDVALHPGRITSSAPSVRPDSRWLRRSRAWVTAFPAIHERRRTLDLAEAARWCVHAGLPEPVSFRSTRTPLAAGAVDLAPVEVNRAGRPALPYSHVELRFAEAVSGPVVIGSGRQRGFGLCIPVDD